MPGLSAQRITKLVPISLHIDGEPLDLADEPTGNLDPVNKQRILDLLIRRARQAGATLLVVTHDLSLLERFGEVIDFRQFHTEVAA